MSPLDRREFLGTSLGSLAATLTAGPVLVPPVGPPALGKGGTPGRPDTLFLTWQRDPTTTMTVQWVGPARDAADVAVAVAPATAPGPAALAGAGAVAAGDRVAACPDPGEAVPVHRLEGVPGGGHRPHAGGGVPVRDRAAVPGVPVPDDAGHGDPTRCTSCPAGTAG